MRENILVLSAKFEPLLGDVRTAPGWKVALHLDQIWLKGTFSAKNEQQLRSLPIMKRYEVDEQQRLFPTGSMTPTGLMPELDWQRLRDFLRLKLPVSALPGTLEKQLPIHLLRTTDLKPTFAVMTTLTRWKSYIDGAPLVRLQKLRFALSTEQEVLVIGDPLPAIPGKGYWNTGNLLVPIGFDFDPPFLAVLLTSRLAKGRPAFILFNENGQQTTIPADNFREADRALVRQIS